MKTKAATNNERKTITQQLDDFFGKGGQVKQLGKTEQKPHRFLVNSKEPQSMERTKPVKIF